MRDVLGERRAVPQSPLGDSTNFGPSTVLVWQLAPNLPSSLGLNKVFAGPPGYLVCYGQPHYDLLSLSFVVGLWFLCYFFLLRLTRAINTAVASPPAISESALGSGTLIV